MYINLDENGSHLVVAVHHNGQLSTMFCGTRSKCQTFIIQRVRQSLPTHFCYIVKNSEIGLKRFKKGLKLV